MFKQTSHQVSRIHLDTIFELKVAFTYFTRFQRQFPTLCRLSALQLMQMWTPCNKTVVICDLGTTYKYRDFLLSIVMLVEPFMIKSISLGFFIFQSFIANLCCYLVKLRNLKLIKSFLVWIAQLISYRMSENRLNSVWIAQAAVHYSGLHPRKKPFRLEGRMTLI